MQHHRMMMRRTRRDDQTSTMFPWKHLGGQCRRHSFGLASLDTYRLLAIGKVLVNDQVLG